MKKEIIGILICTLLISVAVAPVINALTIEKNEINEVSGSNRIVNNNIKLNTPRPTPGHPFWGICFGLIYNLQEQGVGISFNCIYVIGYIKDINNQRYLYHFTGGEEVWIEGEYYRGIVTKHFVFVEFYYC